VSYNLGTIAPKIGNSIQIEMEVPLPGNYLFQISDLNGQICYRHAEEYKTGIHRKDINIDRKLSKGIYLLTVSSKQTVSAKKFVVSE